MGGGQSLNASLASAGKVGATVIYYGLPVTDVTLLRKLQGPVLGIWARRDGWITPEKVAAFDLALKDAGINTSSAATTRTTRSRTPPADATTRRLRGMRTRRRAGS